jgi:4-amino-4-deoxy-L-arabinose transferase-like glycosyltransferase
MSSETGVHRRRFPAAPFVIFVKMARWITVLLLAAGIGAALSFRLSKPELHIDEMTYMSRVLESMAQDAVFPIQGDGSPFMNKPPLAFWGMRLSFLILGPSPFAARLPCVLAAVATALLVYGFGAARWGERAGILGAVLFAFTPGLLALHGIRSATTDSFEILLVTAALVMLDAWRRGRRIWQLAAMVALVGATALVKSPFGVVVFLAILLVTERPARRAGMGTPRLAATLAWVAVVWLGFYGFWLGALSASTSAHRVTNRVLVQQYAHRLEGKISAYHVQGPGYYALSLADDFGPLLLLPVGAAALEWAAAGRRWKSPRYEVIFLLAWALAAPVLGTASISKRPWYAYLSYPGMALLLAVSADRLARAASGRRALQGALLSAVALIHAARIPLDEVWPAEAQYRALAGRLWEAAHGDPRIQVATAPGFRLPRQYNIYYREARLFVRFLLWNPSRATGSCRVVLASTERGVPAPEGAFELQPATRRDSGLYLTDQCGGRVVESLGRINRRP